MTPQDPPAASSSERPRREQVLAVLNRGRRRKGIVRWIVIVLSLSLAAGGYWLWQRRANEPKPVQYSYAKISKGTLEETVTATGTLSPVDAVELGAEVTGRLVKVNVDVNDRVEAGQVLAEIDPEQLRARVQESQAQLNSALAHQQSVEASLAEAELTASRLQALHARGLASAQELETAQAALLRAKASVATAKAQITVARAGLSLTKTSQAKATIVAPISGIVLSRTVEPGQTVTAGFQTPVLFTLARDLSQLELTVEIDEADIGKVQEGQTAKFVVDAYPDRHFDSKLVKLHSMPTVTTTTVVTYAAVLTVDNAERLLRPGMTATATITTRTLTDVLLVPNTALRFQPPKADASRSFSPFFGMSRGGSGRRSSPEAVAPARKHRDRVHVDAGGELVAVPVRVLGTDGIQSAIQAVAERERERGAEEGAAGEGAASGSGQSDPERDANGNAVAPTAATLGEGKDVVLDILAESPP